MANHLSGESSPYLLQHANNPVDWYPWGEEALAKARDERRPIFLSIGYAACHWCHVMEHESFEDPDTAHLLNDHFVAIKVDREQRPDLDAIYMQATQVLTGSGGWPMSVFLTPELQPFYAGTYFPPVRRHNLPAFRDVLSGIAQAWQQNPEELVRVSAQVLERIKPADLPPGTRPLTSDLLEQAERALVENYDREHGGWGRAPKFPQPLLFDFLLRRASGGGPSSDMSAKAASHGLKAMARGGMYDVVGGGFCRYSTDDSWLVPHFEKMLYDNAQLALAYLHAWELTRDPFFERVMTQTLAFVARDMRSPSGGFFSSLDADSEGREGEFYVWTEAELRDALKDDDLLELIRAAYGITARGNWEGHNILQRALDDDSLAARFRTDQGEILQQLDEAHRRLLQARSRRAPPATDDKVVCSWNGLMMRAFAQAGSHVSDPGRRELYRQYATASAEFLMNEMCPAGRPVRSWRNGVASGEVFLEDYGALVLGLLDLYQCSFETRWFAAADNLATEMISRFHDPKGGFFDTPDDAKWLVMRPKELQDGATPSGNSLACEALLTLAALGSRTNNAQYASEAMQIVSSGFTQYPTAFGGWLNAADLFLSDQEQLAVLYPPDSNPGSLLEIARSAFRPNLVVAGAPYPPPPEAPPLLAGRPLLDGRPTAYVCRGFTCKLPVTQAEEMLKQLG
ncbi:MAG: thioredoxin domain-containing protein [Anaerolineales bacterium]